MYQDENDGCSAQPVSILNTLRIHSTLRPVLAALLLAMQLPALQTDTPTFQSGISLLHVDAEVLDKRGRVLSGLTKEDFRVFDDNREQPIVFFSATEQPLDLILLIDISGSMRRQVEKIAAATNRALRELKEGDRVSVMVFNTRARLISPFSADRGVTEQAMDQILRFRFRGGTAIREAVYQAANQFVSLRDRRGQSRRAVLVVTDNIGRPNRSERSTVENLWEADSLLSGLIVSRRAASVSIAGLLAPLGVKEPGGIDGVVDQTGGDLIFSNELGSSFPEMIHRLRSRYSLYYRIPEEHPNEEPAIRVELSDGAAKRVPNTRIRYRRSYQAARIRSASGFSER